MSDIYNKNAREAHLLSEAYSSIYNEDANKEIKLFHPTFASGSPKIVEVLANAQKLIEYWMEKGFKLATPEEAAKYSDEEDKDFRDEQRDQDPHRHKGLSDFDAEQRDQDPLRHSGDLKKLTYSVGSVGGQHSQIMHRDKTFDSLEDACNHAGVDVSECISGEWDDMGDGTKEYGVDEDTVIVMHIDKAEDNEYDSEADAYRAMSDGYKAEDSVKVGNIYKGESYYELVVGIKGNEVFTKKIDLEDGNRYDIKQMHKELSSAGNIDFEFLNEIL